MIKTFTISFLAALLGTSAALTAAYAIQRHQLASETYRNAADSYKRAGEYVSSGVLWYAPRSEDWDRDRDRMLRVDNTPRAKSLAGCGGFLDDYRRASEMVDKADSTAREAASYGSAAALATARQIVADDQEQEQKDLASIGKCLEAVK